MNEETVLLNAPKVLTAPRESFSVREYIASLPIGSVLTGLIVPVFLVLLWETAGRLGWVKPVFLPAPTSVVESFIESVVSDNFLVDFWVSINTVIRGFIWGSILGLSFGTLAGLSKTVERLFGPLLNAIRQVPAIAFLPLIVLWVGIGDFGKLVVISKSVFFPVFLNTLQGIRSVSNDYVEVARVYQFTRLQFIRRVIFPAALPTIFVGVRYGAGIAWAMIVAAEMLSGRKGLGYLLTRGQELLLTRQVFVVIVVIGLVGYLIDVAIVRVEKHFVKWKKSFV